MAALLTIYSVVDQISYYCPSEGHKHGGRKVTETSVTEFCAHLLSSSSDEFSVKGCSNGVKGRLKSSLNFWVETLAASDFVLDMIRRGYRLQFAEYPSECFLKNNRSALQHPDFVTEAIIELLSNGCIVEHDVPPFCVNSLTVAEGKKLCLFIDLRHVNNCLVKPRNLDSNMKTCARYTKF